MNDALYTKKEKCAFNHCYSTSLRCFQFHMTTTHTSTSGGSHAARTSLNTLLAKQTVIINQINELPVPQRREEDECDYEGQIYEAMVRDRATRTFTNFSPDQLEDLYQSMQPFIADAGTRGPKTKSSFMDQLVCYLVWGKLGADYQVLGKTFHIKQNRFEANLDRIRPILNKALRFRWWTP